MRITGRIAHESEKSLGKRHYVAGHHKIPRTLIIVADRDVAKIFSKTGSNLEQIGTATPSPKRKEEMDIGNKDMGRVAARSGGSRHYKYEPPMTRARERAVLFAHEIADWLNEALENDVYDRLVLVAPPQTLGDLRGALGKAVQSRVIAEINKELANLDDNLLKEGLEKVFSF